MKRAIVLAVSLMIQVSCWGQTDYNQVKRISKKEFKELKMQKGKFIPSDLSRTKILIVKSSPESCQRIFRRAHLKSLVKNNFDTVSIDSNVGFDNAMKNGAKYYNKDGLTAYVAGVLKKKGIKSISVDEGHENEYSLNDFKYLFKMNATSTMRDPQKAWSSRIAFYFVDRTNNKNFEVFWPANFWVWDLID